MADRDPLRPRPAPAPADGPAPCCTGRSASAVTLVAGAPRPRPAARRSLPGGAPTRWAPTPSRSPRSRAMRAQVGPGAHRRPERHLGRRDTPTSSISCTVTRTAAAPPSRPAARAGSCARRRPAWPSRPAAAAPATPRNPASARAHLRPRESRRRRRTSPTTAPVRSSVSVRHAEPRRGEVGLGLRLDEARQPGGPSHQHDQQAGREGIERSGVAHRPASERPAHPLHDIVRRGSRRLVHQHRADQSLALPPDLLEQLVDPGRVLQAAIELEVELRHRPRRQRARGASGETRPRSRALRAPAPASASSPGTLTSTRAWDSSLVTCTPVTVTKPTRGSRTSRASASAITWRSVSATCSGRREDALHRNTVTVSTIRTPSVSSTTRSADAQDLLDHRSRRSRPPHRRSRPAATDPDGRSRPPRR